MGYLLNAQTADWDNRIIVDGGKIRRLCTLASSNGVLRHLLLMTSASLFGTFGEYTTPVYLVCEFTSRP